MTALTFSLTIALIWHNVTFDSVRGYPLGS